MLEKRIYLDNNATTGLDPRVIDVMLHELNPLPGNPSSIHSFGRDAKARLLSSRKSIAASLGVSPSSLFFTSGGTEGLNFLIRGLLAKEKKAHVITSNTEHSAIEKPLQFLEKKGFAVSYLPSGLWGAVTASQIEEAILPETRLIVLSAVNNETGVKIDLQSISALAAKYRIPLVIDAVAWIGKEPLIIPDGVTAMAFSGHKFHAPKGSGFVYLRTDATIEPLIHGGGQEASLRAGTENLLGIIALAKAVDLLNKELPLATGRMLELRSLLETGLIQSLPDVCLNGEGPRVANSCNLAFSGVEGEMLLMHLDQAGIAASHGSACSAGALEPSRILLNMGIPKSQVLSSIRFSLSRFTTREEIEICISTVSSIVKKLRL